MSKKDMPAFPAGKIHKRRERPHDAGSDFITTATEEPLHKGVTTRDYFAAKALPALIEKLNFRGSYVEQTPGDSMLARAAYVIADAMLEAREEK